MQGDFAGAWGACAHLAEVKPEKYWVQAVKWVHDYFIHRHDTFALSEGEPCELHAPLCNLLELLHGLTRDNGELTQQIINALSWTCFRIESALTTNNSRDAHSDIRLEDALIATYSLADQLFRAEIWLYVYENYGTIYFVIVHRGIPPGEA